jgi:hypothetical protein
MVQIWTPRSQLRATLTEGEWLMFDRGLRIAVIRRVPIGKDKIEMIRSVTFAEKSEDRILLGYFPNIGMAAEVTWKIYMEAQAERRKQLGDTE